jgi:hypothetical protein
MNSAEYINSFTFDYVETWMFTWENNKHSLVTEATLHQPNSKRTGTFKNDHPTAKRIIQILKTEIEDSQNYLCDPVYREAFVFYDENHKIKSILNICLTCLYMSADGIPGYIKGDYKTYEWLRRLFLELGHPIANPEYSIIEDYERMLAKIKKRKS